MALEHLYNYPGYSSLPDEKAAQRAETQRTETPAPQFGSGSRFIERPSDLTRLPGESEQDFHNRRMQEGVRRGHALFEIMRAKSKKNE